MSNVLLSLNSDNLCFKSSVIEYGIVVPINIATKNHLCSCKDGGSDRLPTLFPC